MNIKSLLAKPFAGFIQNKIQKGFKTAVEDQESILLSLIKEGKNTEFGKEHSFQNINGYDDFKQAVPVRDYEGFKNYITLIAYIIYLPC